MLFYRWMIGVMRCRPERLVGAMAGVAVTVALLASLGIFLTTSATRMTVRAIEGVPVDWQIQLSPGADQAAVLEGLAHTFPNKRVETVAYADAAGLTATTGGTVQTTGSAKVIGIGPEYMAAFPREIRLLTGSSKGVLVAQQTAANLHVKEGDTLTIMRQGLAPVELRVDGTVDLPYADSLFQSVGASPGTAPHAPPDNVLLIPEPEWHLLFDPQAAIHPDSVRVQLHARLGAPLPPDPSEAYLTAKRLASHLEAISAAGATVGNNLAARLEAVRSDALYARVLFLFLGLPGVTLAVLLTLLVVASGRKHHLVEQALLRIRGASLGWIWAFQAVEALLVGLGGVLFGAALTGGACRVLVPDAALGSRDALIWLLASCTTGFLLAIAAVLAPATWQARRSSVSSSRPLVRTQSTAFWLKLYLDGILLAIAAGVFWKMASSGYEVVLAPEGVPQISVHYEAFVAPFCFWIGGILLAVRVWKKALFVCRGLIARALGPFVNNLSAVVAAFLGRQRILVTRGVMLVGLAVSFAVSTSVFNTTYNAQARIDAELTNGADVAVKGTTTAAPGDGLAQLRDLPGVAAAQAMMHRFAYVGNDLQDLYGIDPHHIGEAAPISEAFFVGGKALLDELSGKRDGILVSEETKRDFQLEPGDLLNLRLQFPSDHKYHVVPFHFIGVVREFPTAPTDSFLVANADYIAEQTGSHAREIVLLRAVGDPADLAAGVRRLVGSFPGVSVTDIAAVQKAIGSSLTSVDLRGLSRLESAFSVLLILGATGLMLALSLYERRRDLAILAALGARSSQLGAFVWSEGALILGGGSLVGLVLGLGLAEMLVKLLQGVFDPPPEQLVIPWSYLAILALCAGSSAVLAVMRMKAVSHRAAMEELRKL